MLLVIIALVLGFMIPVSLFYWFMKRKFGGMANPGHFYGRSQHWNEHYYDEEEYEG